MRSACAYRVSKDFLKNSSPKNAGSVPRVMSQHAGRPKLCDCYLSGFLSKRYVGLVGFVIAFLVGCPLAYFDVCFCVIFKSNLDKKRCTFPGVTLIFLCFNTPAVCNTTYCPIFKVLFLGLFVGLAVWAWPVS